MFVFYFSDTRFKDFLRFTNSQDFHVFCTFWVNFCTVLKHVLLKDYKSHKSWDNVQLKL